MVFEWDANKAAANVAKHGVRFEDAVVVFDDPRAIVIPDDKHSQDEIREIVIGSASPKILTVVFTIRAHGVRRIIGARRASRKERKQYEKGV